VRVSRRRLHCVGTETKVADRDIKARRLLSAAALWKYASECHRGWRPPLCLGVVVTLQIAFQTGTLSAQWLHSPRFRSVVPGGYFRHGDENIDYVAIQEDGLQGDLAAIISMRAWKYWLLISASLILSLAASGVRVGRGRCVDRVRGIDRVT